MAGKTTSKHQKLLYAGYKSGGREGKNRLAKLTRHVLKFPEDGIAARALIEFEKLGVPHRRKRPRGENHTVKRNMVELESMITLTGEELSKRLKENKELKEQLFKNSRQYFAVQKLGTRF